MTPLVPATALGVGIGLIYFVGLWMTVLVAFRWPRRPMLIPAGLMLRIMVLGIVLASVSRGSVTGVVGVVAGILIARSVMLWHVGRRAYAG